MATSGTTSFAITAPDLILEAFDRLQIRGPAITLEHLISGRRSANLVLSRWPNRGVNLWKVDLVTINLIQGVASYQLDAATVEVLDTYLRTYQMGSPISFTPGFATTLGSPTITITEPNNGLSVGSWIQIIVPVAVGGLLLAGFYQVVSVTSPNTYTITAAANATSTVANGGAVPVLTSTNGSTSVSVALANHGYLAGQNFPIQVSTTVGGLTLQGNYPVATVPNANTLTITVPSPAGSNQTVSENGGAAQIAGQVVTADPIDRIMYPISRTDYASLPDKIQQGSPTTFWFDRTTQPILYVWQVPDGNGPYVIQFYRTRVVQDVTLAYGQNLDMPPRFFEAACAEVAAHLAIKWKPELVDKLTLYAKDAWTEAAAEDRERVTFYLSPQFDSYYN